MCEKRVHHNKYTTYLKPKNQALFDGFVKVNEVSESEALNMIVKEYFNRIPESERIKYLTNLRSKREY